MITGELTFAASIDYDGDGTVDVTVISQKLESHANFYLHEPAWQDFGAQLIRFPQRSDEVLVFDDSYHSRYRPSLRLEAYCYDWQGHAALRVITDNNAPDPRRVRLEFSIPADAGSLNQLGHLLMNWQPELTPSITWQAQVS